MDAAFMSAAPPGGGSLRARLLKKFFQERRAIIVIRLIFWGAVALLVILFGVAMIAMPGKSFPGPLPPLAREETEIRDRLKGHIGKLAGEIGERNLQQYEALKAAARYIEQTLRGLNYPLNVQVFKVEGEEVRNLEAERTGNSRMEDIILIGAHYDTVADSPGANDNGSGVAAMLELARFFATRHPARTIRLAAFVNEEAPYFGAEAMGSFVYAREARRKNEKIIGMMSLETIGYFSDAKGSQQYPLPFSLLYPDTGNFIGFVANTASRAFLRQTIASFRRHARIPSEGVASPEWVSGIGWSDHYAFWKADYAALMVTDTAPFRYPYYHTAEDTPDKIDYDRLARVVWGLGLAIEEMAGENPQNP